MTSHYLRKHQTLLMCGVFYNNKPNNIAWGYEGSVYSKLGTFIPPLDVVSQNNRQLHILGADRSVDTLYNQAGVLTSVTYPTGGVSSFVYETNKFKIMEPYYRNNYNSFMLNVGDQYEISDSTFFTINEDQTMSFDTKYQDRSIQNLVQGNGYGCSFYSALNGTMGKLYKKGTDGKYSNLIFEFKTAPGTYTSNSYEECYYGYVDVSKKYDLTLVKGDYKVIMNADNFIYNDQLLNNGNQFSIAGKYIVSKTFITEENGGGLRIKKIENSSDNQKSIITYKYEEGVLMSTPVFTYLVSLNPFSGNNVYSAGKYAVASSSTIYPLSYSALGNPIGYGKVTESKMVSGISGKIISTFINEQDDIRNSSELNFVPGVPTKAHLSNGLPITEEYYDESDKLQYMRTYSYNMRNSESIKGAKSLVYPYSSNFVVKFYDCFSEWWTLDQLVETSNINDVLLTKTTSYNYNSKNYQKNEIIINNSNGINNSTKILYPCDINNEFYKGMTAKNITELPIETSKYVNNLLVNSELSTYNSKYLLNEQYKANINSPLQMFTNFDGTNKDTHYDYPNLTFSKYSILGRQNEIKFKDGSTNVYLWGYNYQYPIAEIKNATYDQVKTVLGDVLIDRLATSAIPLAADLATLNALRANSALPAIQVTTYTYKPLVGMLTATSPNGLVTTYEYDAFNRLKYVKDHNGKIITEDQYHYKQ